MAKTALPRSQYLAALRRRQGKPARQAFRKKYSSAKPKPKPKAKAPPEDFLAPRTPKMVRKESRQAAKLEFGQPISEQRALQRGAQTFATQTLPSLYDAYRQQIAQAGQATQAAYQQAQAKQQASEQALQGQYQQQQAQRGAEAQKTGQVTGTPLAASQEAPQAQYALGQQNNAFQGLLGQRQAENTSYFGQLGAAGTQRQAESAVTEQKRQQQINADLKELLSKRGTYISEFRRKARGEERQFAAESQAFGLKTQQAGEAAAGRRASRRIQRQGQKITRQGQIETTKRQRETARRTDQNVNEYGYTNKRWKSLTTKQRQGVKRRQAASGGGGTKGDTPASKRTIAKGKANARDELGRAKAILGGRSTTKKGISVPKGLKGVEALKSWAISQGIPPSTAFVAAFTVTYPGAPLKKHPKVYKAWKQIVAANTGG